MSQPCQSEPFIDEMITTRNITIGICSFWLISMTLLVRRDLIPLLLAGPPPGSSPRTEQPTQLQAAIILSENRLGTVWTHRTPLHRGVQIQSLTVLESLPLLKGRAVIDSHTRISDDGTLEELSVTLEAMGMEVHLIGEQIGPLFTARIDLGQFQHHVSFEAPGTTVSGQPFGGLGPMTGLHAGRTWTMHWYNPLNAAAGFETLLVRVQDRRSLKVADREHDVWYVEAVRTGGVTRQAVWYAWIDDDGNLLQHRCAIGPLWFTVKKEDYDEHQYQQARKS